MNPFDLGLCCYCRERQAIGFAMMPYRAPDNSNGWGCVQCGLPTEGAIAVFCEPCGNHLETEGDKAFEANPRVVVGEPRDNRRVVLSDPQPFEHDLKHHPEADAG